MLVNMTIWTGISSSHCAIRVSPKPGVKKNHSPIKKDFPQVSRKGYIVHVPKRLVVMQQHHHNRNANELTGKSLGLYLHTADPQQIFQPQFGKDDEPKRMVSSPSSATSSGNHFHSLNLISFINAAAFSTSLDCRKGSHWREEDQVLRLCCFVPHSQERGIATDEKMQSQLLSNFLIPVESWDLNLCLLPNPLSFPPRDTVSMAMQP